MRGVPEGARAKFALMQERGGTTAKYENGRVTFAPEGGRPTCSVVCIKRRAVTPEHGGDENNVKEYVNNSPNRKPVYETTACKKQIGSLDPYERCTQLYEERGVCGRALLYYRERGKKSWVCEKIAPPERNRSTKARLLSRAASMKVFDHLYEIIAAYICFIFI